MKGIGIKSNKNDVALENDFMFTSVMRNKRACIKLLDAILDSGHRIADIRYVKQPDTQKSILFDPMHKGVRLDVFFDDGNTVYDIELQRTSSTDLAERSRLYSSSMDVNMLDMGESYANMRTSYVIFLCTFDPFGKDEKVYKFSTSCENVKDLPLGDRRYIMFLNSKGSKGYSNLDMDELFKYLNGGVEAIGKESKSELVTVLDRYVQKYNSNDDWRREFMKLEFLLKDRYNEGKAAGETNATSRLVKGFKAIGISDEDIAKGASISVEEVRNILNQKAN